MTDHDQRRYPWGRFYFGAWLTNPTLLFAPLRARGLAVEIMALAYCSERPGFLVLQGKPMTPEIIARLRGLAVAEVKAALVELERVDLFARDKRGVWFCPQMVEDLGEREHERNKKRNQRGNVPANVPSNVPPQDRQKERKKESGGVSSGNGTDTDYQRKLKSAEEIYRAS
jgi:hypothetical protein